MVMATEPETRVYGCSVSPDNQHSLSILQIGSSPDYLSYSSESEINPHLFIIIHHIESEENLIN